MTDTPRSYPSYRFYQDGREIVVHSQAELEALPPGHAGSPAGPFPSTDPAPPPPEEEPPPDEDEDDTATDLDTQEDTLLQAEARALQSAGQSQQQIAHTLGISRSKVRRFLRQ